MNEVNTRKVLIKGKMKGRKSLFEQLPAFRDGIPVRRGVPLPVKGERLVIDLDVVDLSEDDELVELVTTHFDAAVMAVHPDQHSYDIVIRKKIPAEASRVRIERYEVEDENL